jgi:hypothetical protein
MKRTTPEAAVLAGCLQLLKLRGVLAWRNVSTPAPLANGAGFRRYAGMRGLADIVAVIAGRIIAIEAKSRVGRQSPEQLAFQSALEAAGGTYWLIRDVRDLECLLNTRENAT